ncbi:MAG: Crp/Fnr family transcriptional regulator [Myxococcota bacterium]|nr:Crp/Fnr family transcriptional regulator [Myxococcota bacterium]MDW8360802.1 Crp/Fnr family transcriptional regulator [Myxococcales bacterium]
MQGLGEGEQARLLERFGRAYEPGAVLYDEGQPARHGFVLHAGRVRIVRHVRGIERVVRVVPVGELFGEEALGPGAEPVYRARAVALSAATVLALDRETLGALLAGNPRVARRMVEQFVARLEQAEERIENAMLRDHPSRVVNTLLRLAAVAPERPEGRLVAISPLELSARVGLDVDAVKRTVQQLRDGGYVRIVDERVLVPDLEALRRLFQLLGAKEEVRDD